MLCMLKIRVTFNILNIELIIKYVFFCYPLQYRGKCVVIIIQFITVNIRVIYAAVATLTILTITIKILIFNNFKYIM